MTAIAYKDGVLAADEAVNFGVVDYQSNKVWKHNGYLMGMSGKACPPNDAVVEWLFKKTKKPETQSYLGPFQIPKMMFDVVVITPNKKILWIDSGGGVYPIQSKIWATGCGEDICIGAMAAGATAKEAVAWAIYYKDGCKGRVRYVSL